VAEVLLLDGDTRQVLPVAKALRARRHRVTVACEERLSIGWMSRYPHRRVLVPSVEREPGALLDALRGLLRGGAYDVMIPLFDPSAHLVAQHLAELERLVRIPLVELDVFMRARDKALTMQACEESGVPCPRTWYPDREPLESIAAQVAYPVLVKPRISHGAMGIVRVERADQLSPILERVSAAYGPCIVQEFIPPGGAQYKAQFFRDRDGSHRASIVFSKLRWYPVAGGTSSLNQTVERDDILESGRRLLDALDWRSYADLDYIEDPRDGVAKVMEINPRVTGSVKIAFEAGIDFADLLVRFAQGDPLPRYDTYRVGVQMRYLPLDLLWFLSSPDRFRARPSWFRFFGRDLCWQVLSLRDPGPFLALGLSGARKLRKPEVRAAKAGMDAAPLLGESADRDRAGPG